MSKHRALLLVAVVAALAGVFIGRFVRLDAAAGKPSLVATFGPVQVEGQSRATFFLALRNTGAGDATLALGDLIEIRYGTKGGSGDLLAAGQTLTVDPLPTGLTSQQIAGAASAEIGTRLSATGPVVIAAGSSLVLTFEGATAGPGAAPVSVAMKFGRTAGKTPKALALSIVKTPPVAQTDFYGDGSDGSPTIVDGAALQTLRNYVDVIIPAGASVSIPSGATIRCTGRFENHGNLVVQQGSPGGGVQLAAAFVQQHYPPSVQVERGDALSSPATPASTESAPVNGAQGGIGLGTAVHSLPLSHYRHGGGGGTGTLGVLGGAGGGLLRVIARGPIVNTGVILAHGSAPAINRTGLPGADGAGGGGGGGGIVVLASGSSVENANPTNSVDPTTGGIIDVSGGAGGTADPLGGAGGGGGGGLVVFCAPTIVANGTTYLQAGLSGFPTLSPDSPTDQTVWSGGGGGGACVGNGGSGGPVRADGHIGPLTGQEPPFATAGALVVRTADPRTLWR